MPMAKSGTDFCFTDGYAFRAENHSEDALDHEWS